MTAIPNTPERQAATQAALNAPLTGGGGSFTQKLLRATFALQGSKSFGGSGNTVTLDGLRMSALITWMGVNGIASDLQLRVWGMDIGQMNALSTLGLPLPARGDNFVVLEAGTSATGLSKIFEGAIYAAWADFQSMPDVVFNVHALTGGVEAVKPTPPLSYDGGIDIATVMADIAKTAGLQFENNGVSGVMLHDPYFPGTAVEQARRAATAANIFFTIDRGTLAVWPNGGARGGTNVPLVSRDTGMKGYPTYTGGGITVETLFNPSIIYGGKIVVESDLPAANGEWVVYGLIHNLESQLPGGQWISRVDGWHSEFGGAFRLPPVR